MVDTYSISLDGMQNAQLRLERAARDMAVSRSPALRRPESTDSVQLSTRQATAENASAAAPVDYAREMLTIIEAKIAQEADLKAMATQQELDRNTLDLLA